MGGCLAVLQGQTTQRRPREVAKSTPGVGTSLGIDNRCNWAIAVAVLATCVQYLAFWGGRRI